MHIEMNSVPCQETKNKSIRAFPAAKIFGNALKDIIEDKRQSQVVNQYLRQKNLTSNGAVSKSPHNSTDMTKISTESSMKYTDIDPATHPYSENECPFYTNKYSNLDSASNETPISVCKNLELQHHDSLTLKHITPDQIIAIDEVSKFTSPQHIAGDCKNEVALKRETIVKSNHQTVRLDNSHYVLPVPISDNEIIEEKKSHHSIYKVNDFHIANNSQKVIVYGKETRIESINDSVHKIKNVQTTLHSKNQKCIVDYTNPLPLPSFGAFSNQCSAKHVDNSIQYEKQAITLSNHDMHLNEILKSSPTTNYEYIDDYRNNINSDFKTASSNKFDLLLNGSINYLYPNLNYYSPPCYNNYGRESDIFSSNSLNSSSVNAIDTSLQYFYPHSQFNKPSKMRNCHLNFTPTTNNFETSHRNCLSDNHPDRYNSLIPSVCQTSHLNDVPFQTSTSSYLVSNHVFNSENEISSGNTTVEDDEILKSSKSCKVSQQDDDDETDSIFFEPSFYTSLNTDGPIISNKAYLNSAKPFVDTFINYDLDELNSISEEEMVTCRDVDSHTCNSNTISDNLEKKSTELLSSMKKKSLGKDALIEYNKIHAIQNFQPKEEMVVSQVASNYCVDERNRILPCYPAKRLLTFRSPGFIDSHCHIDLILRRNNFMGSYADFRKKHCSEFPVSYKGCVAVFCYPDTFDKKYLWEKHLNEENVWASFGCHPKRADSYNDYVEKVLCEVLKHPQVRAVGEIGLDYSNGNNCLVNVQQSVFRRQIEIALNKNLPLVIHCRDAYEDCLHIMKLMIPKEYKIHMHCFKASWEWAEKFLGEFPNLCIGITNVVTLPEAKLVHEVAKKVSLNRLLIETDAPYFVPNVLHKDTFWTHPGMAIHVAAQITALRGITLREVLHHTLQNTKRIYGV